jgi:hypothetical protein
MKYLILLCIVFSCVSCSKNNTIQKTACNGLPIGTGSINYIIQGRNVSFPVYYKLGTTTAPINTYFQVDTDCGITPNGAYLSLNAATSGTYPITNGGSAALEVYDGIGAKYFTDNNDQTNRSFGTISFTNNNSVLSGTFSTMVYKGSTQHLDSTFITGNFTAN